jgi:hypothetical protein
LLGQPARPEPFQILVKEVHGDEALLRAGEAVGLYAGSELRRGEAAVEVVKTLGIAESAARITAGRVVAGDRLDVTKWASPEEPVLRVYIPPGTAIGAAIQVGAGTPYPGIARMNGSDAPKADYRLLERSTATGVEYSWVRPDGAAGSPLPPGTGWSGDAAELTEYAVRLAKLRGWLKLQGHPGQSPFPYRLVLRRAGTNANVRAGVLHGGERYKLFLQLDPEYRDAASARRWVYVFALDQNGTGTLLFPAAHSGNEGNHLPSASRDELASAPVAPWIGLTDSDWDIEISEPWGIDTYVVIASRDPIPNPEVLNFEGVQPARGARRAASGNALQDLLESCGDAARDAMAAKAPAEWSIERLTFQSVK